MAWRCSREGMRRDVGVLRYPAGGPQRAAQVREPVAAVKRLETRHEHLQHVPVAELGSDRRRRHESEERGPILSRTLREDRDVLALRSFRPGVLAGACTSARL